jgi:hypothetical protein
MRSRPDATSYKYNCNILISLIIRDESEKERNLRERAIQELEKAKKDRFEKILQMHRMIDGFSNK